MINRSIDPWWAARQDDIMRRAKERILDARTVLRARWAAIDAEPNLTGAECVARIDAAYEDFFDAVDAVYAWASEEMMRLAPPLPPLPPDPRRTLH